MIARAAVVAISLASLAHGALAQRPLKLYAAGSLRAALTEVGAAFTSAGGAPVVGDFGASGLLKDRLAQSERADVLASANMEYPQALATDGKAGPARRFARNRLCALVAPRLGSVTPENLLDRMLDPAVKLGASTPREGRSKLRRGHALERCSRTRRPPPHVLLRDHVVEQAHAENAALATRRRAGRVLPPRVRRALTHDLGGVMKLSARNVLPGKVVDVKRGATTSHVRIDIGGGTIVTASITNEAVDDLALKAGDSASAVIKASDVIVGK